MMTSTSRATVKIKLEGGVTLPFNSTNPRTVLDDIYKLAHNAPNTPIEGTSLHLDYPRCGKTHVLVSTKDTDHQVSSRTVYGIKCGENEHLTYEEVIRRIDSAFGSHVLEGGLNLTAYKFPVESSVSNNGTDVMCGVLYVGVYVVIYLDLF